MRVGKLRNLSDFDDEQHCLCVYDVLALKNKLHDRGVEIFLIVEK